MTGQIDPIEVSWNNGATTVKLKISHDGITPTRLIKRSELDELLTNLEEEIEKVAGGIPDDKRTGGDTSNGSQTSLETAFAKLKTLLVEGLSNLSPPPGSTTT